MGQTKPTVATPLHQRLRKVFPAIDPNDYIKTSDFTTTYNCIAWAVHSTFDWYCPWDDPVHPKRIWIGPDTDDPTLATFQAFFEHFDYCVCKDGSLEPDVEKIAIYELCGEFSHVARQRTDGLWSSKLGDFEDVLHERLAPFCGDPGYGVVSFYMKRRREPEPMSLANHLTTP